MYTVEDKAHRGSPTHRSPRRRVVGVVVMRAVATMQNKCIGGSVTWQHHQGIAGDPCALDAAIF